MLLDKRTLMAIMLRRAYTDPARPFMHAAIDQTLRPETHDLPRLTWSGFGTSADNVHIIGQPRDAGQHPDNDVAAVCAYAAAFGNGLVVIRDQPHQITVESTITIAATSGQVWCAAWNDTGHTSRPHIHDVATQVTAHAVQATVLDERSDGADDDQLVLCTHTGTTSEFMHWTRAHEACPPQLKTEP